MKAKLKESRTPLVGFSGKVSYPIRTINLSVTTGESERLQTIPIEFVIVKSHSPYNVKLGQTDLRSLGAVASTIYSMIKFPTSNRIATMTTERNPPRISEDGRSTRTSHGKKDHHPLNTFDAVISDLTPKDLAIGTPSSKILAKAESSHKRKASTSGANLSHVVKHTRSALAQSFGSTTHPSLFVGDSDDESDGNDDACVKILLVTPLRSIVVIPSSRNQGRSSIALTIDGSNTRGKPLKGLLNIKIGLLLDLSTSPLRKAKKIMNAHNCKKGKR
nr:reverse transcriptase domain-containing protein [Tanacetum cinerariifolium]